MDFFELKTEIRSGFLASMDCFLLPDASPDALIAPGAQSTSTYNLSNL